jgi:hypothetical protein
MQDVEAREGAHRKQTSKLGESEPDHQDSNSTKQFAGRPFHRPCLSSRLESAFQSLAGVSTLYTDSLDLKTFVLSVEPTVDNHL